MPKYGEIQLPMSWKLAVVLLLRSDFDPGGGDDDDGAASEDGEGLGFPERMLPQVLTQMNCTWLPMGTPFRHLLCVVLSRAINHGVTVPRVQKTETRSPIPHLSFGSVPKLNTFCALKSSQNGNSQTSQNGNSK